MTDHEIHLSYMQRALALARDARYRTRPNPTVGCVIVKDGQVIGEGATQRVGGAHAEVQALQQAGADAKGAHVYVTLEPCAHHGRTPPCADALINAKVTRVFAASLDPNPQVSGQGIERLKRAGIECHIGLGECAARELNQGFLQVMQGGRPYVRLKIASSLDGKTAMSSGESKWITGIPARQDVQHWRALSGAVITGIGTLLADDPMLNVRSIDGIDNDDIVQPYRVILDRQGRLPLDARILQHPSTVIVMGPFRSELAALGVDQIPIQPLFELLETLKLKYYCYDLLVECGATLATAFLEQQLVDEVIQYIAPIYLGHTARSLNQFRFEHLYQAMRWQYVECKQIGEDIRVRLRPLDFQSSI